MKLRDLIEALASEVDIMQPQLEEIIYNLSLVLASPEKASFTELLELLESYKGYISWLADASELIDFIVIKQLCDKVEENLLLLATANRDGSDSNNLFMFLKEWIVLLADFLYQLNEKSLTDLLDRFCTAPIAINDNERNEITNALLKVIKHAKSGAVFTIKDNTRETDVSVKEVNLDIPTDIDPHLINGFLQEALDIDALFRISGEISTHSSIMEDKIKLLTKQTQQLLAQNLRVQKRLFELETLVDIESFNVTPNHHQATKNNHGETLKLSPLEMNQYNELHSSVHALLEEFTDIRQFSHLVEEQIASLSSMQSHQQILSRDLQHLVMNTGMSKVSEIVSINNISTKNNRNHAYFALPAMQVKQTISYDVGKFSYHHEKLTYFYEGEYITAHFLAELVGLPIDNDKDLTNYNTVIVTVQNKRYALAVDKLIDSREWLVTPAGRFAKHLQGVSDLSILSNDAIAVNLDLSQLLGSHRQKFKQNNAQNGAINEEKNLTITSVSTSEVADLRVIGLTDAEIAEILEIEEFNDGSIIEDTIENINLDDEVTESEVVAEDEDEYSIDDLRKMGFSDDEICSILEIDSLEEQTAINTIEGTQDIKKELNDFDNIDKQVTTDKNLEVTIDFVDKEEIIIDFVDEDIE